MKQKHRISLLLRPGLLWAIALFILLELFLRGLPSLGMILGINMDFSRYYYEYECESKARDIEILFLGDSTAWNSLHPGVVARELGVEPSRIYNLSYGGGSPFSFLPFLNKNLPKFSRLKCVIWLMNDYRFTSLGGAYPELATMDLDTMAQYFSGGVYYWDNHAEWLSRVYRLAKLWQRPIIRQLFFARWLALPPERLTTYYFPSQGGSLILTDNNKPFDQAFFFKQCSTIEPHGLSINAFQEMVTLLASQKKRFIVIRHALSESGRAQMQRDCARVYAISQPQLARASASPGVTIDLEGLANYQPSRPEYFWDFQHLTYLGSIEYSRYIARHLLEVHAITSPERQR